MTLSGSLFQDMENGFFMNSNDQVRPQELQELNVVHDIYVVLVHGFAVTCGALVT